MRRFGVAVLLLASLWGTVVVAGTLNINGSAAAGALMRGFTDPGAQVVFEGKPLRVAPDGHFIFGFGRDAQGRFRLDVLTPDGGRNHSEFAFTPRQYDIRRIDGLPPDQVTPDPVLLARIKRENALVLQARATDSDLLFFEKPFRWPALGPISGVYGSQSILNGEPRQPHYGVDIAAPQGSPVHAANGGVVTLAERDLYLTGGTVVIDHGYGLSTTYMHMASLAVAVGQKVAQGEVIGTVGATGRVTGPHLDWRANWYEVRLDAMLLVGPMPQQ